MSQLVQTCVFIFARGGSKGVPGKNIKFLGDKPLIAHSIELAKKCPSVSRVIVSTDSEEIASVAREYGAEVPFLRPKNLAEDNSPEWLAWQHAVTEVMKNDYFDYFVSLPTTSPFRAVDDVEKAISMIQNNVDTDFIISACKSERNPWFNMVKVNEKGFAEIINKLEGKISRRQDAPESWDVTTVLYVGRPSFILNNTGIFSGKVKLLEIPKERALDIDTPYDFLLAEFLYKNKVQGK